MDGVQETLAGRIALLNMTFLSQSEIADVQTTPFTMDFEQLLLRSKQRQSVDTPEIYERIFCGGIPALVSGQYSDRHIVYASYISTYIDQDVKELSGTIDSLKFMSFITAAAGLSGQMLNYKTIGDSAGINQITAKDWMGILEKLGIIFYLHPYFNNVLKRTVTKPKLYFYDTGLVAYLTKWSDSANLMHGAMSGAILENYVVSELIKSYHNSGEEAFVYYYRDKDSKEIDLVLERDGKLFPIEIKKTATPAPQLTRVFGVLDKAPLVRGPGAVICTTDRLSAFDTDHFIIPVWAI